MAEGNSLFLWNIFKDKQCIFKHKLALICGFMVALTCTRSYHRMVELPKFGYAYVLLLIQGVLMFVAVQKWSQCAQNFHTPLHGCSEFETNPQIQPIIMN